MLLTVLSALSCLVGVLLAATGALLAWHTRRVNATAKARARHRLETGALPVLADPVEWLSE